MHLYKIFLKIQDPKLDKTLKMWGMNNEMALDNFIFYHHLVYVGP